MTKFIKVSTSAEKPAVPIPLDDPNKLWLSTLKKYFPQAIHLQYKVGNNSNEVLLLDGEFHLPEMNTEPEYYCVQQSSKTEEECCSNTSIENIRISDEEEKVSFINMVHISVQETAKRTDESKVKRKPGRKSKKRKLLECEICSKKFLSAVYLERHTQKQHSVKSLKCESCEMEFTLPKELKQHVRRKHPRIKKSETEDDLFETLSVSVIEMSSEDESVNPPSQITKTCESRSNSGDNEIKFDLGNSSRTTNQQLRYLLTNTDTQFTCEECKKTFSQLSKLKLHLFKCHTDKEPKKRKYKKKSNFPSLKKKSSVTPRCKYVNCDIKDAPASNEEENLNKKLETVDEFNEGAGKSYLASCDCISQFSIIKYIEEKIPPEILEKFQHCQANNIPWTGYVGYSALYKFWVRIVTDNPIEETDEKRMETEQGQNFIDDCFIEEFIVEEVEDCVISSY